jgi:hypothetical protein
MQAMSDQGVSRKSRRNFFHRQLPIALIICIVGGALFALRNVTCPYCHGSDHNVKGACVKRKQTGHCPEGYGEMHYNVSSCPWCHGYGAMPWVAAVLD